MVRITTSNVVHMGDLFFNKRFPYIDLKGGGSVKGYLAGVQKASEGMNKNTIIIPGHGPMADKKDLDTYITMIRESIDTVTSYKKQGLTLQQAQKKGVPKKWKNWSWGFINEKKWIATLYKDL